MFEEDDIDERRQLDAEWLALNAVRETLGIANRGLGDSTYLEALGVGRLLAPDLFDPDMSVLAAGQEPPLVREYRQRAESEAVLRKAEVSPLELLDADIAHYERLREARDGAQLRNAIRKFERARDWLVERSYTEHRLITRDVHTAVRPELPCAPRPGDRFVEFELPFERALRIRLLHPDKPEHSTGADLVYEFCDQRRKLVRLAFVQYKMWDGATLHFSGAKNLVSQLDRLETVCCRGGLCAGSAESPPYSFRLPYCAGFLRPTDRLQSPDAKLISRGIHVPVCIAQKASLETSGGRRLLRDPLRSCVVSQRLFEELFNRGMLGSPPLAYDAVERLYREHSILASDERIVVYAQEFSPFSNVPT